MNQDEINKKADEELKKDKIVKLSELAGEIAKKKIQRYRTRVAPLDQVYKMPMDENGGLSEGDLVIISAPTGQGKTLLSATLTRQLMESGLKSCWFSYEVNALALWQIFQQMGTGNDSPIYIPFEHTTGKLGWVTEKILEAKELGAKLFVIDHLGFLSPHQSYDRNMSQNYSTYLTSIVRELKTLAVREEIIIILPVHMNKSATDNPSLRDIANSAGIAQEADLVILMAREEEKGNGGSYYTPYTQVKIAKNRPGGETPTFWMTRHGGRLTETIYNPNNQITPAGSPL